MSGREGDGTSLVHTIGAHPATVLQLSPDSWSALLQVNRRLREPALFSRSVPKETRIRSALWREGGLARALGFARASALDFARVWRRRVAAFRGAGGEKG